MHACMHSLDASFPGTQCHHLVVSLLRQADSAKTPFLWRHIPGVSIQPQFKQPCFLSYYSPGWLCPMYAPSPPLPAPLLHHRGHEVLMRLTNTVTEPYWTGFNRMGPDNGHPCNTNGRSGRPFSCHLHGSASLAPYDGWAEDETCYGKISTACRWSTVRALAHKTRDSDRKSKTQLNPKPYTLPIPY